VWTLAYLIYNVYDVLGSCVQALFAWLGLLCVFLLLLWVARYL
jgi:hypothetical protein